MCSAASYRDPRRRERRDGAWVRRSTGYRNGQIGALISATNGVRRNPRPIKSVQLQCAEPKRYLIVPAGLPMFCPIRHNT